MKRCVITKKYFPIALALAVFALVDIAVAHAERRAENARETYAYAYAPEGYGPLSKTDQTNPTRLAAIRHCNIEADQWAYTSWQTTEFAVYRTCMAEHGQGLE